MNRLKRWLLPLLTVLLIGAGAAMPWAAARVQDLYGIAGQEVWPFDPVSLTLRKDSEIGTVLRLMGSFYDETEWPGETNMTEEDACAAALDALTELDRYGLLEPGYISQYGYVGAGILERLRANGGSSATPLMFISLDGTTAIVWVCHWKGTYDPCYDILVDDATGKAVIGDIPCPHISDIEAAYQRMERWRTFFQDYYGFEVTQINDQSYDDLPRFLFLIDPEDGLGELGIMVRMYSFEMDFSPWLEEDAPPPVLPEGGNAASMGEYYDINWALLPN